MNRRPDGATGLERIFAAISTRIDDAGPERSPLFLARLALLLSVELADEERALALIAGAATSETGRGDRK